MRRPKIAIVHPPLGWGGSEAVALWTLTALKDEYDVSLITSGQVDIQGLNEFYGTSLTAEEFSIVRAPLPRIIGKTFKFAALRGRFVQRYCQQVASNFDLMISTYNPQVFSVKGIQLVADLEDLSAIIPLRSWKRWWYGNTPLRKAYLTLCDRISSSGPEDWKANVSLANSNWTAELMRREYGMEADVLYPPVPSALSDVPYGERRKGFISIGRIIPEKRIETIVEILRGVRGRGHDVHLHVVGSANHKNPYARRLRKECLETDADWVSFEGSIGEESKNELIAKHRFGISGRKGEPFGIAVAEMVEGGCIVFVPDNGGQVEIVNHPDLVFDNVPDAIDKIDTVLTNQDIQERLRDHLAKGAQRFSVDQFKKGIQNAVSEFFAEPTSRQAT